MKYLIALLAALSISTANAQTVETTPNLITSGSTHTWTGVSTGSLPPDAMPGGPGPLYDPVTNTIHFSYGQGSVAQTFAINQALQGSGIQVQGYNYSWQINNNNYDNRQGNTDTLTASVITYNINGSVYRSDSWTYNTKFDWTTFSGTVNYANPTASDQLGNLTVRFTGIDSGYWGGYFGPQVRNVQLGLNYTVDPCVSNPLYSSNCPGFNDIITSGNLVPNPAGIATWGQLLNQTFAISTAIQHGGLGIRVHGFEWGYNTWSGNPYCANSFLGVCTDNRDPLVRTWVNIRDAAGNSLYSATRDYNDHQSWVPRTYSYQLPQTKNSLTLGNFEYSGQTWDYAGLSNMWARIQYTPDECVANPLYSTSCSGYQQAYFDQQCTANPLYNTSCPGYQQAFFNQQCTINQLYNPACPGYAQAYLDYQCSQNPLYSTTCVGYQTATTTCNQNPLSHSFCPAYQTATTECNLNPLYGSYCPGYQTTLAQCTNDPLGNELCPGYQFAYSCSIDGLYSSQCPNYADAYAKKNILGIGSTTTPVAATTTIVLAQATADPVAQAAPVVADPVVNNIVSAKPATANAEANPAAAVKVTAASAPAATPTTQSAQQEKKSESTATAAKAEEKSSEKPKTAREQLAEQRREAAKKEAVNKGKELANEMGKAADMAAQVEVQNVVIQAMGFTPGFDVYSKPIPDGQFYRPYEAYPGQRTIDTPSGRRLFGGSDSVHREMVDRQYNLGK